MVIISNTPFHFHNRLFFLAGSFVARAVFFVWSAVQISSASVAGQYSLHSASLADSGLSAQGVNSPNEYLIVKVNLPVRLLPHNKSLFLAIFVIIKDYALKKPLILIIG